MTGRSGRVLRNKSGKYKYVKRFGGPSKQKSYGLSMPVSREDESDRLNIVEKRKFMEGKKSVAIISDAASTGISLHADRRCNSSHKRRVHFTIEVSFGPGQIDCSSFGHRLLQCSRFYATPFTSSPGLQTRPSNNWEGRIELARKQLLFTRWS